MATGQKTEFEINAKDKTKRGLLSAQKNLKKTGKEADKLAGRFRNVARATVIMEGPLGGTAGRLSAMATMLNSVGLGTIAFGVGLTGMTAIVVQSMKKFAEWEVQTFKINQLLEQTGGASGLAGSEIEEMAIRIGEATLSSANDVRAASAVLLTFKSIATDAFERTLDVASDLAAITGQDLKQSVIQLGKALEDPMTGMSALRRSGVSFTNSQKDMIVAMKESGDVAGAQAEILSLLEGQLGGAGAAAGSGLSGAADLLSERWSNLMLTLADTGAGGLATRMFNHLAESVGLMIKSISPSKVEELAQAEIELDNALRAQNKAAEENSFWFSGREETLRKITKQRAMKVLQIKAEIAEEEKAITVARKKGKVAQEAIRAEQLAEAAATAKKKSAKEAEKQLGKDVKGAEAFGAKLIAEEQKLSISLLNKGHQEDMFLEQRLAKIDENLTNELISKESAHEQEQAAFAMHNANLTTIHAEEKEKQAENEKTLSDMQIAATKTALGDIGSLMAASSKKLFKIGQAAAIANAFVSMHGAIAKTMEFTPAPWNIPLAIGQGIASMVQIQKIKQQKMAAREFGGSVISGRSYLVGERGPELFTAPRTGQIINNSATNNVGGQSNTFNITNVLENDDAFINRNAVKIWDSIIDRMNEEGLRFA